MNPFNRVSLVYYASGDTFPHREEFISWAWHWNAARNVWIEDNNSAPNDPAILYFLDAERAGIEVTMRFTDTDGCLLGVAVLPNMAIHERTP